MRPHDQMRVYFEARMRFYAQLGPKTKGCSIRFLAFLGVYLMQKELWLNADYLHINRNW